MKALPLLLLLAAGATTPGLGAPAPGPAPSPTLAELFPKIVERAKQEQDNDRNFNARYRFLHARVTEFRDGQGEVKKRETRTSTNDPALKAPRSRPPRPPAKPASLSATNSNVRGKQFETEEFAVNSNLVARFTFKLLDREVLNDRPMLVIDFAPKPGKLPERNLKDKFINRTAGRVWVDAEDYAIVKASLRLTERVNVLGGLVGAIWKFTYGFERERTADGLWFTRDEQWHLEGREVIFERIVDFHGERKEVRPAAPAVGTVSAAAGQP